MGRMRKTMTTPTALLTATMSKNGACHPQRLASKRPMGMPMIWLAENAVCTTPITRPRLSGGNRSAMMAKLIAPMTPPNRPVIMRAARRKIGRAILQRSAQHEAGVERGEAFSSKRSGSPPRAPRPGAEGVDRDHEAETRRGYIEPCIRRRRAATGIREVEDHGELQERQNGDDPGRRRRDGSSSSGRMNRAARKEANRRPDCRESPQPA
jgi:hypothetical protein